MRCSSHKWSESSWLMEDLTICSNCTGNLTICVNASYLRCFTSFALKMKIKTFLRIRTEPWFYRRCITSATFWASRFVLVGSTRWTNRRERKARCSGVTAEVKQEVRIKDTCLRSLVGLNSRRYLNRWHSIKRNSSDKRQSVTMVGFELQGFRSRRIVMHKMTSACNSSTECETTYSVKLDRPKLLKQAWQIITMDTGFKI